MPVEFKAPEIKIKLEGAIAKLPELIGNKQLGLMLHGKSIAELEHRILEFKDFDITWVSMNKFDVVEKFILYQARKELQVVLDVGEVQYVEDFEKQIRIPRWMEFLRRPRNNLLITSQEVVDGIHRITNSDMLQPYYDKIIRIQDCRKLEIPNSLALYLLLLNSAKKIYLFGCDGFGKKEAFRNTPLWDGTEMIIDDATFAQSIASYYKPEYTRQERMVGFKNELASNLHSDSPTFNDQIRKILIRYYKDNNLPEVEIINCSPMSLFTAFKKITYQQLKGEL